MPENPQPQRGREAPREREIVPAQETERRVDDISRSQFLRDVELAKSKLKPCSLEMAHLDPQWDQEHMVTPDDKHYYFVSKDGGDFFGGIVMQGEQWNYIKTKPTDAQMFAIRSAIRDDGGQYSPAKAALIEQRQGRAAPVSAPQAPAPQPARPPEQTPATPERSDFLRGDLAAEKVFGEIAGLQLEVPGQEARLTLHESVDTPSKLASRLRKLSIPIARYEQYAANMRDHASQLSKAMSRPEVKKPFGAVLFDGQHLSVSNGQEYFVSMATTVLRMPATGSIVRLDNRADITSVSSGNRVNLRETSNGMEVRSDNGIREIHRSDGGLQLREVNGERHYFDGSNTNPIMVKKGRECDVVGPEGDRVGMKTPQTFAQAEAHANEIAVKLKTPEAIGAYISQFFWGQEYHSSPEHGSWLNELQTANNPVQYKSERVGMQDVQHYQRTLTLRSGDCEDFALLAQGLLKKIGVDSCVTLVATNHYEAVYFEPAGRDLAGKEQYHVCQVGLYGYKRSAETYSGLGDAMKSTWGGTYSATSGAKYALSDQKVREAFAGSAPKGDGIAFLEQNKPDEKNGQMGFIEYTDQEALKQFVRRS